MQPQDRGPRSGLIEMLVECWTGPLVTIGMDVFFCLAFRFFTYFWTQSCLGLPQNFWPFLVVKITPALGHMLPLDSW